MNDCSISLRRMVMVAMFAGVLSPACVGQSVVSPAVAAKPAVNPSPFYRPKLQLPEPQELSTVADGTRYLNRPDLLTFCTEQVAAFNGRDADILFIGDSIVSSWMSPDRGLAVWNKYFANRNALNFGVSGDLTQHVLWRMEQYPIARLHPKVAVIMIGSNNTSNTPVQVAAGVEAVVEKTQSMWPNAKIILMSITPFRHKNQLAIDTNAIIKNYADGKTVFWVDLFSVMVPEGDNWKGIGPDHTHPNAEGFQMWADVMLPVLNRLLPPPADAKQP